MAHKMVIAQEPGMLERLAEMLHLDTIAHKLGTNKHLLIDIGLYGAIGFITGFLFKKYSEYVIVFALIVIGLIVLQQFDFITISLNMTKMQEMFGIPHIVSLSTDTYLILLWEWIKSNVLVSASMCVGFLIGLKVG